MATKFESNLEINYNMSVPEKKIPDEIRNNRKDKFKPFLTQCQTSLTIHKTKYLIKLNAWVHLRNIYYLDF